MREVLGEEYYEPTGFFRDLGPKVIHLNYDYILDGSLYRRYDATFVMRILKAVTRLQQHILQFFYCLDSETPINS